MDILVLNAVPFVIALLLAIPEVRRWLPKTAQTALTTGAMLLLFIAFIGYFPYVEGNQNVSRTIEWMPELGINASFYLDGLSLLFSLIISGIGAIIFFYSGYYFEDKDEQTRFNTILMTFAGAMLGLVIAGNIITMFIMWELTSITSFLLISFKGDKDPEARFGGLQALIITGGGGLALIGGLVLLGLAVAEINGTGFVTDLATILHTKQLVDHDWYTAILLLILLGAFTKSAQFPFHFWLPGAMSAPTPASAYLHSATMVKAGIYLLLRLYPVMYGNDLWSQIIVPVGFGTMVVAAFFSIKQRDLKALLAYSTVSKLGAIVGLIGLPDQLGLKAALVGILAHALYKAALFLTVGTVDHAVGTRIIDKLGGLYKHMPITAAVATISGLSMAGIPFFFGFVAKEVLIAAAMDSSIQLLSVLAVFIGSVFTAVAAYILIWDVYFRPPKEAVHIHHHLPAPIDYGPALLALGSLTFGFLLQPLIIPILDAALLKEFELKLFPGFHTEFFISLSIIVVGFLIFALRQNWLPRFGDLPISGTQVYQETLRVLDRIGDGVLFLQHGWIRYYLVSMLIVLGIIGLSGTLTDLLHTEALLVEEGFQFTDTTILELMLLFIIVGCAIWSVLTRRHLIAALALGLMGYGVAALFIVEQAPDVALVQFMVETLSTVLVIIIIGRASAKKRKEVMELLWKPGRGSTNRNGMARDLSVSVAIGFIVFVLAATALANRPSRETIAQWHLENADAVKVDDVVSGILTDFRGMDTLLEIGVFSVAALGILALLTQQRQAEKQQGSHETAELAAINGRIYISTPFTRMLALFIWPFTLLIAVSSTLYGAYAPGDGFTGGVIAGLGVAAWYIVFGYKKVREENKWFHPVRILVLGLGLAILNAVWPLLIESEFLSFHKLEAIKFAGLSPSTTMLFEIAIGLTVFGSVGVMLEAITHPTEVETLNQGAGAEYNTKSTEESA